MKSPANLGLFSVGVGDRFARQARAQLRACLLMAERGCQVTPVWNKSNREHLIVGSEPTEARAAAAAAVQALSWGGPYFVDADHIRLETVDRFLGPCDFFTIDVADQIGQPAPEADVKRFVDRHPELTGRIEVPGVERAFTPTGAEVERMAGQCLLAVREAGKVFRHVAQAKGANPFVTEVSMDETARPQTPPELLVILAALADEQIPLQTIAPKFSGRFNKGVDYVGDVGQFEREINDDMGVIAHAIRLYRLPADLKLSIHSGSDKFSIYPAIRRALVRHRAGVHLKTAGTTWLEECIGLAEAGGEGLTLVREIYAGALAHLDELCAPYASVIDIDRAKLPTAGTVKGWSAEQFVAALRHDPNEPAFNPHLRQLLHVGYKVAAQLGRRYLEQLEACQATIARNVTANLLERHLAALFL